MPRTLFALIREGHDNRHNAEYFQRRYGKCCAHDT